MASFEDCSLFDPSEQHKTLRRFVRGFTCKEVEPQAGAFDEKESFNLPLFRKTGRLGLLGLLWEKDFGGAGLDLASSVLVHEELAFSDPGFTLAYLAHSVLCGYSISRFAASDLKKRVLPRLASGEWVGAMAMSEADCGTDALAMQTSAAHLGGKYIVNGKKMWITNGFLDEAQSPCDCCLLYCKLNGQIASFVVEKSFPGFSLGRKIRGKLGMRSSHTAELIFNNCEIPESHLLQKEGLKGMMQSLEVERLAISAISLGIAKRCLKEMNQYGSWRKAFGRPLRAFGQIQKYIAQSHGEFQSLRSFVYSAARAMAGCDLKKARLLSDSVKLMAGQTGKKIADRAIQTLGGRGYMRSGHVERFWRDSKLLEIGGGSIEALEKNIAKDLAGCEVFAEGKKTYTDPI